ncbi:MAG: T9SS type A sorting domain-containing protein [Bacteroidetes bacterium]|nr:T9SS type A sorting domain-containing protein [Bacteroidota bacterium]
MKKNYFSKCIMIIAFAMFALNSSAQTGNLVNSGKLVISGESLYLIGSLINQGTASVTNSGTISLYGNLYNNGVFISYPGSRVTMAGDTQRIAGSTMPGFMKLYLAGTGIKTMEQGIVINDSLFFTSQSILLGNSNLVLMPGAIISGASNSKFAVTNGAGKLIKKALPVSMDFLFPVGNSSASFKPVILNYTGTIDTFAVRVEGGIIPATNADSTCVQYTYHVEESNPGGTNASLKPGWNNADEGTAFDRTLASLWQYQNGTWKYIPGLSGASDNMPETDWYYLGTGITNLTTNYSKFIVRNAPPEITVNPVSHTKCQGNNTNFSISATGNDLAYLWQKNSGSGWSNLSDNATFSGTGAATLNLMYVPLSLNSNLFRCIIGNTEGADTSLAAMLTVNPVPPATNTVASGDTIFCFGYKVKLKANLGANLHYKWLKNNMILPGDTLLYYWAKTSGYYSVIVTNGYGCSDTSSSYQVTALPLPVANAGTDTIIITGTTATLHGSASGSAPPFTYLWSAANIYSGINTPDPTTYPLTQTTNFVLTVTDYNDCENRDTVRVLVVGGNINVDIVSQEQTICEGDTIGIEAIAGGCTGNYSYSWSCNTSGWTSALVNPDISPAVTTVYTVTVTDGTCSAVTSKTITVYPNPLSVINAEGDTVICQGESVVLSTNTGFTYQWQHNGYDIGGANLSQYSASQSGAFRVIVTDAHSCHSVSDIINVTVNLRPVVNAGADTTITYNTSAVLHGFVTGTATPFIYQWTPSDLIFLGVDNYLAYTDSLTNTRTFTLHVTDNNNCQDSDKVTVSVIGGTLMAFPYADHLFICLGDSVRLYAMPSGGTGQYIYSWTDTAGFSSSEANPYISPAVNTNYMLLLSDGNDTVYNSLMIYVNPVPDAEIYHPDTTAVCSGSAVILSTETDTGFVYCWKKDGSIIPNSNSPQYPATLSGDYSVVVTNVPGCTKESDYISVDILPLPQFSVSASGSLSFCDGQHIVFEAGLFQNYLYQWHFNSAPLSDDTLYYLSAADAGEYYVSVTDTTTGCSASSQIFTVSVLQNPVPVIMASDSLVLCLHDSTELFTDISYNQYLWSTGSNNPAIYVTDTNIYSVTVTDMNGCMGSGSFQPADILMPAPPICIVLVDSTINKNLIVWEKEITGAIDYYNVYKETAVAGVYAIIGTAPYDNMSMFVDTGSNPDVHSDRYKLSSVDTCGDETALSPHHRTLHLGISPALPSGFFLNWVDSYEGFTFYSYRIYRWNTATGWQEIDLIQSNLTSYTDPNPPAGTLNYLVAAVKPDGYCTPTGSKDMSGPFIQSLSNTDEGVIDHISDLTEQGLYIYPNPVKKELIIEAPAGDFTYQFIMVDAIGQTVLQGALNKRTKIDMSDLSEGVYWIRLFNEKASLIRKVVKQ